MKKLIKADIAKSPLDFKPIEQRWLMEVEILARKKAEERVTGKDARGADIKNICIDFLVRDTANNTILPFTSMGSAAKFMQKLPIGVYKEPKPAKVWFRLNSKKVIKKYVIDNPLALEVELLPV